MRVQKKSRSDVGEPEIIFRSEDQDAALAADNDEDSDGAWLAVSANMAHFDLNKTLDGATR